MEKLPAERVNFDSGDVEHGFAKLVLIVVELLRNLVERQAMRRIEGGSLTDEEIERLGYALWQLEDQVQKLIVIFGLEEEELNINLGPLGKLL